MAERFLYLPLVGLAGLAALLAERVATGTARRPVASALIGLILVACAARTIARNRDWRSDLDLWAAAARDAPDSAKAHAGYATALFNTDAAHDNLGLVIAEAERAIAIRPDYRDGLAYLGMFYVRAGGPARGHGTRDARAAVRARRRSPRTGPLARPAGRRPLHGENVGARAPPR